MVWQEMKRKVMKPKHILKLICQRMLKTQWFYEQLYLYQSHCWVAFIRQDYLLYYRYTQMGGLFEKYPAMIEAETAHYIKGMHNLMSAHFDLSNEAKLNESIEQLEKFSHRKVAQQNENYRILCFVYLSIAKINKHFLKELSHKVCDRSGY
jgi:hypothetical protein